MRVVLIDFKPIIYREFLVSNYTRMPDLHLILQTVMGWTNSHLHQFEHKGVFYQEPDPYEEWEYTDYSDIKIGDLLKSEGDAMAYTYDFGDDWKHVVSIKKIMPFDENKSLPECVEGENSCPPEDCGGLHGYRDMLKIIKDPDHEEYEEWMEWLGGDFNPSYFDIHLVNGMLMLDNFGVQDGSEEE